jgi:hypothetical protein
MQGFHHRYIPGIRVDADAIRYQASAATPARFQLLHIQQSPVDASCGLAALLMAVMVLRGTPRSQIEGIRRTKSEPLRSLWAQASHKYFEGTTPAELAGYAKLFGDLDAVAISTTSAKRIGADVTGAIDAGSVPLVCFRSRGWSHWSTVIAIEDQGPGTNPSALLLLDPWAPAPAGAFNGRMALTSRSKGSRFAKPYVLPYERLGSALHAVQLYGLVVVRRAAPP